ncbi:MAG: peptidase domain-containing ABC transporter [Methylobacter sp.]
MVTDTNKTAIECFSLLTTKYADFPPRNELLKEFDETNLNELDFIQQKCLEKEWNFKFNKLKKITLKSMTKDGPVIALLKNGNYVILMSVVITDTSEICNIYDPLCETNPIEVSLESFNKSYSGRYFELSRNKKKHTLNEDEFGLHWIIDQIKLFKFEFISLSVAAFFINLFTLAVPLYFMIIIDKVVLHKNIDTLYVLSFTILFIVTFEEILGRFKNYFLLYTTRHIDSNISRRVVERLLKLPVNYFENIQKGIIAKKLRKTEQIRHFITSKIFILNVDIIFVFIFLGIIALFNWMLALIIALFAIALVVISIMRYSSIYNKVFLSNIAESERDAATTELLNGIDTIKALGIEGWQKKRIDRLVTNVSSLKYALQLEITKISSILNYIEKIMVVVLLWLGAYGIMDGWLTTGGLVAVNMLARRITGPIRQVASAIDELQEVKVSLGDLKELLNQETEDFERKGIELKLTGNITFKHLYFKYADSPDFLFSDINLTVNPGEIVAIVGDSGAGKTTLLKLMLGMISPSKGSICFDHTDIKELDLSFLRRSIGTVLQNTWIQQGSIRDNISCNDDNITDAMIVDALRKSGAYEFVMNKPKGIHTKVREGGLGLSGGQIQRISLSRALARDAKILFLDEVTSSLGPEAENKIEQTLLHYRGTKTIVMATHSLSMISIADRVIYIHNGHINDIGAHAELCKRNNGYKTLLGIRA